MDTITKEQRMQMVLEGKLSDDYLTYEEVVELQSIIMDAVAHKFNTLKDTNVQH